MLLYYFVRHQRKIVPQYQRFDSFRLHKNGVSV
jgi:hypothetical protein